MSEEYGSHYSVLLRECIEWLTEVEREQLVLADLTFGAGGHTSSLAKHTKCKVLYAFDQDPEAIENGKMLISSLGLEEKINLIHSNFEQIDSSLSQEVKFDGVLIDLGVSSHQFDSESRGFSFRFDAPLDMRMNPKDSTMKTAADLVEELSEEKLVEIFQEYGEEKYSKRIARKIVEHRQIEPIKTTKDLENLIFHAYPKAERYGGRNPATKIFQALRIAVNRELEVLTNVIDKVIPRLRVGGRLAVISFHSLEDRIVKQSFRRHEKEGPLPCQVLTKRPVLPTKGEILENSRSRSAKLRVIERVVEVKTKNKYPSKSVKE